MDNRLELMFQKAQPGDIGIIGDPISHSLSPVMHNAAIGVWKNVFEENGKHVPTYHSFQVSPGELEAALRFVRQHKLRGVNVTVPHKVAVCPLLDELDSFSHRVGAVNTVVLRDGKLKGFNTDGPGFEVALSRDLGFEVPGKKVLLMGGGGTGRVIANSLEDLNVQVVYWWNRNPARIEATMREMDRPLPHVVHVKREEDIKKICGEVDLIVNATSVGLRSGDGLPSNNVKFAPNQSVFDVIYNRDTAFQQQGRKSGARVCGGLSMLVSQGAQSFQLWMGTPAPYEVMKSVTMEQSTKGVSE